MFKKIIIQICDEKVQHGEYIFNKLLLKQMFGDKVGLGATLPVCDLCTVLQGI